MKKSILSSLVAMSKTILYSFVIQCFSMSVLLAYSGSAQVKAIDEVPVKIELQNSSVEEAFSKIESATGYNFVYTSRELKELPMLSLSNSGSLYDLLVNVSLQTGLNFKQINKNIHVRVNSNGASGPVSIELALQETVTGTVVDDAGIPLPGVSIIEKGTSNGTVNDVDGKFTINVASSESILMFSFIGMQSIEEQVGERRVID